MCTIEGYKKYYSSLEFQKDLMSWFNVEVEESSTYSRFPMIKFADRRGTARVMPSETREKSFYFSFCVFLHALQAQAISKVSGKDMMYKFHAETGVPMISCGMGGLMHPSHMLCEAEILPNEMEVCAYIEMIDTIMPAIRPQTEELNMYAPVDTLYTIIEEEIKAFRERLEKKEKHPSYFIL